MTFFYNFSTNILLLVVVLFLTSACQHKSQSFPPMNLSNNVNVRLTCVSYPSLCDRVAEKGGEVKPGLVDDSVVIEMASENIMKLETIKLCGHRAVTPNIIINFSDELGTNFIFTLNTAIDEEGDFILGSQSVVLQSVKYSYPCTKQDGEVLLEVLSYIFYD